MRNLKKLLAVLVVAAMMITVAMPVFAADSTLPADTQTCANIGMLIGPDANGVTADYATTQPSRLQAAILFLRLKGLEKEALAFSGDNFSDSTSPVTAYLKAHPELGFLGIGDGKFDPDTKITAAQYYKVVLTALGYKQDTDFAFADVVSFAASKGLTKVASVSNFTIADLATATVEGLKAAVNGGTDTLAATLIKAGKLDEAKATAAGVYTAPTPPAPAAAASLDMDTASTLTSQVIEVTLNTAVTAVDKSAATVKDAAGKAVDVTDISIAPYVTDGKTVLVTLGANTAAGTLYTITSGTQSINFGGKAASTDKPTVDKITSTEYNEVTAEFSAPVKLDGATAVLAEKYGTKAALTVTAVKYGDASNKIVFVTSDQKDTTLYGATISGVSDFEGNVMDSDDSLTFTGTGKPTDNLVLDSAFGQNNPEEVIATFSLRVDTTTIDPANFKVEEMYGTKAVLPVTAARISTTDDLSPDGINDMADDVTAQYDAAKNVILTVPGLKSGTLYKLTVSNLKTAYGVALSSTAEDTYKNFAGLAKPTDAYTVAVKNGAATDNTTLTVNFKNNDGSGTRKIVQADAENIANYSIAEAYGSKAALAVSKAELQSNGTDVVLTVASMKNVLYKLTVTGIKDIYGNGVDTDSDANIISFAGAAVASKITKITGITRDPDNGDTQIIVTFDQNVGANATDVSHYSINNSVGYPTKAETGWADAALDNQVRLTIPETNPRTTYTLSVTGLVNADGVAMDSGAITGNFAGQGNAVTLPQLVAAMPLDDQTVEIYFDRDVTDSSMDGAGKIWNDATHAILVNAGVSALGYMDKTHDASSLAGFAGAYAYQDSENDMGLIIRLAGAAGPFKSANKNTSINAFKVVGATGLVDPDNASLVFAPNDNDPTLVSVDAVMAINSTKVRVYFNQPVVITSPDFARIDSASATTFAAAAYKIVNPVAVDNTDKVYDFATVDATTGLSKVLTSSTYYLTLNPAQSGTTTVGDTSKLYTFDMTSDATTQWQFAGSGTAAGDITDVSVVMTDAKTIVVYYPEAMDTTAAGVNSAVNPANYTIVDSTGAAVTMKASPNHAFTTADIGDVTYDDDSTSATFNTATIILKNTIVVPAGGAYLQFGSVGNKIQNATKTAVVKDGTDLISNQFAVSTVSPALLYVSAATYDDNTKVYTVTLNQKALTGAAGITTGNFLNYFTVTFNNGADTTATVATVTEAPSAAAADDTIKFTLTAPAAAAGKVATILLAPDSTVTIKGINGEAVDTDASAISYAQ